jgi:hypothetical protein
VSAARFDLLLELAAFGGGGLVTGARVDAEHRRQQRHSSAVSSPRSATSAVSIRRRSTPRESSSMTHRLSIMLRTGCRPTISMEGGPAQLNDPMAAPPHLVCQRAQAAAFSEAGVGADQDARRAL